jgi:hypothetical protein
LPPVVLGIEQEIRADNRHADGDCDENEEHQQHEAVDIVNLVRPERCEDEIPEIVEKVISKIITSWS